MNGAVLRQQFCAERRQLRPQGQGALQVVVMQRIFFDTDEVQTRAGRGLLLEQLPGAEEVQPGAETRFADVQAFTVGESGEARCQIVVGEEDVACLFQAVFLGEIDVAVAALQRLAALVPVELGVMGV